jgi:protein-disulfide isomerase
MKLRHLVIGASLALALTLAAPAARAQFLGQGPRDGFLDTTILRPPAGSKVALIVFEDLGCPFCARAHPLELKAVEQTHVTLLRYDFPLAAHVWTFEGAVCARYIQDHISPQLAGEFRSDVFASQGLIANKDDIDQFTATWLKKHGHTMPPALDPDGALAKEVSADLTLGQRLNVQFTPTIVVVTRDQYQVIAGGKDGGGDPEQILPVVQAAIAQAK